jgi:hypothetical protein
MVLVEIIVAISLTAVICIGATWLMHTDGRVEDADSSVGSWIPPDLEEETNVRNASSIDICIDGAMHTREARDERAGDGTTRRSSTEPIGEEVTVNESVSNTL